MGFYPFEVTIPHIFYASLGGFVVLFGMFSLFLREKLYIGEACWAFLFGVIIGPYGADIFDPRKWGGAAPGTVDTITLEVTRVVLAIGVFAIGVELPKAYMARHWRSLAFLLVPVMTWGWFVSAGLIFALVPGLNFLSALAVAACLTPTDPILAAAVVGGKYADKHVPAHIRHLLAAESGCNDGAAFPFLYIALYLILDGDAGAAVRDWLLLLWLYQVILGVVIGACIGFAFRHLMKFCEAHNLIDRQSYVAQYISLAVLTIGLTTLLGSDDLLAAFACGTAFAWDGFFNRQTEEAVFSSVIDLLFNIAAFIYVGAWMPFSAFSDASLTLTPWRLVVIALLVLLFRRLPAVLALYRWIPDIKTFREAVFSGHFGPIGVGGVFISTLAAQKLPVPSSPPNGQTEMLAATIQPIVAFMVLCSIVTHGLSIPSFSLGRRVHSVSRTWSRHATGASGAGGGGVPDWMGGVARVDRPEDIVINRDREAGAAERGELPGDEKLQERGEGSSEETRMEGEGGDGGKEGEGDGGKEENAPDGEGGEQEWREGPHKIVERRAGPGEEVEVEVIRNAYAAGEADEIAQTFSGTQAHVRERLDAHLHELEHAGHEVAEGARRALSPRHDEDQDEDEGWASDGEPAQDAEPRTRSRSPRVKPAPSKPVGAKPGRRRNSMRKGLFGRAHLAKQHAQRAGAGADDAVFEEDAEDARRGRGADAGSLRSRLDGLRVDPRREASPARSVRWADGGDSGEGTPSRSGTSTPRVSILHDASAPASPHQNSFEEAKGRVTFDLP
ncbi:hypothetical protein HWV62_45136 [Athelia sp. TMB]|nr:hypothetical protein HWV62_45136 [Athelia sp. TMB]